MPKVKIKEFKGIHLNADENDVKLEYFRNSLNMRHRDSYVEVEPRMLVNDDSLPRPNDEFGIYGYNFEWETGIYATLAEDRFKQPTTLGGELAPALTTGNWTLGAGFSFATSPNRIRHLTPGNGSVTIIPDLYLELGAHYNLSISIDGWAHMPGPSGTPRYKVYLDEVAIGALNEYIDGNGIFNIAFSPRAGNQRISIRPVNPPTIPFNLIFNIYRISLKKSYAPDYTQYNVLVLIAKAFKDNKYHRLVYLRDYTLMSPWMELSKYGSGLASELIQIINHEPMAEGDTPLESDRFVNSFFSTIIDGEAFFKVDRGILKLYLPHDSFWIGRWNRKVKVYNLFDPNWDGTIEGNDWYIDRLVEPFDANDAPAIIDPITFPPPPGGWWLWDHIHNAPGRRIGWIGIVQSATDIDLEQKKVNYQALYTNNEWGVQLRIADGNTNANYKVYPLTGQFAENGQLVDQTVPYMAPTDHPEYNDLFMYGLECRMPGDTSNGITTGMAFPDKFFEYYELYDPITNEDIILADQWWAHHSSGTVPFSLDSYWVKYYQATGGFIYLDTWFGWSDPVFAEIYGEGLWHIRRDAIWDVASNRPLLNFRYKGSGAAITGGFSSAERDFSLVVTALLDDRDEVIISAKNYKVNSDVLTKWVAQVTVIGMPPLESNLRITRLRYYFKLKGDVDFDLVKEHDFIAAADGTGEIDKTFTIYPGNRSDIYLSTNIGFLLDEERFNDYQIISGFKSVATKDRVSIGIATGDQSNIYYNVVGGGNVQSDVMLKQNKILMSGVSALVAVSTVSDKFVLVTDRETFLVQEGEALGQLVFSVKDTLEYGIKDKHDLVEMKGAVILHTRKGIYVTDGYKVKQISEPINNFVETNYLNGNIKYNPVLHELYYFLSTTETFHRYRFEHGVWEPLNLMLGTINPESPNLMVEFDGPGGISSNLKALLVDFNGENAYLQADALSIKSDTIVNVPYGLVTNEVDFGFIDVDKLLNYIDVDYIGTIRVHWTINDVYQGYVATSTSSIRTSSWLYIPLAKRIPFKKIRFLIEPWGSTTKLYSLEFDINSLKRRRS